MNYNCILHIDSFDQALGKLVMKNAINYLKGLPDETFELAIVANGPAVKLFVKENSELYDIAKPVIARGVKLLLCNNALEDCNLRPADLWAEVEVVPAGLVEVVRLQREGFAYIKP